MDCMVERERTARGSQACERRHIPAVLCLQPAPSEMTTSSFSRERWIRPKSFLNDQHPWCSLHNAHPWVESSRPARHGEPFYPRAR